MPPDKGVLIVEILCLLLEIESMIKLFFFKIKFKKNKNKKKKILDKISLIVFENIIIIITNLTKDKHFYPKKILLSI
jgi:hypothetical protein